MSVNIFDNLLPENLINEMRQQYFMKATTKDNFHKSGCHTCTILPEHVKINIDQAKVAHNKNTHPHILQSFDVIKEKLDNPSLRGVVAKSYQGDQHFLFNPCVSNAHYRMKGFSGAKIAMLFLTPKLKLNYLGQVLLWNDNEEIETAIMPIFNRMIVFNSTQRYTFSLLSRLSHFNIDVIIFSTMSKGLYDYNAPNISDRKN